MQPNIITQEMFLEAVANIQKKKKDLNGLEKLKFEKIKEGLSAQVLYIGPYTEETETIDSLHKYIKENNLQLNGNHHEIYLNDPRKTTSEKLKTIIRQPVK